MEIKEALEICKRLYPVGSKYISADHVTVSEYYIATVSHVPKIFAIDTIVGGYGYLYANDKFAELYKDDLDLAREIIYKD